MWRRIQAWLGLDRDPCGPCFVIHKRYALDLPVKQYDAQRPLRILSYLEKRHLLRRGMLRRPRPVSLKRLERVHERDYLASLEQPGALEPIVGIPLDTEAQDRFLAFQRLMTGGTLRATRSAVYKQHIAVNLGGGFHHAKAGHGSGFCVFNDIAVAIDALREGGFTAPILVIDLDLHDGDGTRAVFATDPTVHTYSIHNRDLGGTAAVESTCIALGGDIDDETYLQTLRRSLPPVIERFAPGLVIYLAGSDPSIDDRLGNWRITLAGMLERDRFVMTSIRNAASARTAATDTATVAPGFGPCLPCAILLAGGYGPRAWRHGAAFFSWLLTDDSDLRIPPELELPVGHYRRLARLMRHPGLRADEMSADASATTGATATTADDWGLHPDDLAAAGAQPTDTRFLGLFTRYGVELALEQSGLLDRLRDKGFGALSVDVFLDDPQGHMIRVQSLKPQPQVLIEAKLRIDRAVDPGYGLLAVEWLLIQDAGNRLDLDRPLLPGQTYPGLGLLRDMAAVLIVLCERLELDGLSFTPSHYHLAALARPLAVAADADEEARFQALRNAMAGLHLREAAQAVEGDRVIDRRSGEVVHWRPARLVIPVSAVLQDRYSSTAFKNQVDRALATYDLDVSD